MKNAYAIVDLQFGSTGKGLLAGYLATKHKPDTVVCAFGPNAGHTFIDADKNRWVHVMVPMAAVCGARKVLFGPGSVVHPELLHSELEAINGKGHIPEVFIHENAVVVQERHREQEAEYGARIGSTMKGTGAAMAERMLRKNAGERIVARDALRNTPLESLVADIDTYNEAIDAAQVLQIEGAQGFSLSMYHGFYPYTTSRDCTVNQLLADCGVPYTLREVVRPEVWGTARTFPIRVNNRGFSSGPAYPDQVEVTWESLGMEPELTTVTKLPRRIFTFSERQIAEAIRMNGVDAVFLNFCNYLKGQEDKLDNIVRMIEKYAPVLLQGHGPAIGDVEDTPF